jgi:PAS domain S-box-containing protein
MESVSQEVLRLSNNFPALKISPLSSDINGVVCEEVEYRQIEAALAHRAAQLALINDMGSKIVAVLDLDDLLKQATDLVQGTFNYHHVALFLVAGEAAHLKAVAGAYADDFLPGHTQPLSQGIIGWVITQGQPVMANDVSLEPKYISLIAPYAMTRSELCLPIRQGERILGALDIQSPRLNAFDENDLLAMEALSNQMAVAIENARLYQAVNQELVEHRQAEAALQLAYTKLEQRVEERTAALTESEAKYRTLIEQSGDAIYLIYGGKFEIINHRFEEMFGVTAEMANSPNFVFTNIVAPKSQELIKELVSQPAEGLRPRPRYEFTALDRCGHEIEVELTVSYPSYRGGLATQGIIRDITDRKRAEVEKNRAYQQAQQYAAELVSTIKELRGTQAQLIQRERLAALGQMAATVAHELRNPLMGIQMGVDYLLRDISPADPRWRSAALMQANMERLNHIVEDILFVARAPQPTLSPGRLQTVIEAEIARWELALAAKKITCHTHIAANLPLLLLDPDQMGRVFTNLIANSADVLPPGGQISIGLELRDRRQEVVFADNGPGIAPEHLPRIFEPFYSTKTQGTGLGLYIIKQIVEFHGGEIAVWSETGAGARFTLSLPWPENE